LLVEHIVVKEVTKRFPGTLALDKVSFTVYRGEIHALLGENGAGKSTLVKILYGIYTPDEGEVYINGKKLVITSPRDAVAHGIVLVSQTPTLINDLTIVENIILSLRHYNLFTRTRRVYSEVYSVLESLGLGIDPNTEVYKLTYTQKQMIEIARALLLKAKVLLLDEATSYLPLTEKKKLFDFLKKYVKKGNSVILITHKLPEALEISDRITVLRKGKVVGTVEKKKADITVIRRMMFGDTEFAPEAIKQRGSIGNGVTLFIENLWVKGELGEYMVRNVTLSVRKGEILGIAGITGSGQVELFEAIMGLRKVERGIIKIDGVDTTNKDTGFIRSLGVGYIPDNPLEHGLSIDHTLAENIALCPKYSSFIIDWHAIRQDADRLVREYGIVTPSINTPIKLLSGGNLMKMLISRELEYATKLLVAYNPTRGLDEYTANKVRRNIKEKKAKEGLSVIFASEDLDEIFELSDTIAVMNSGRIVGVFDKYRATRDRVEELMVM